MKNILCACGVVFLTMFAGVSVFGQMSVASLGCDSVVIAFDNSLQEEKTLHLVKGSWQDTLIFLEDFSRFPVLAQANPMCNSNVALTIPYSYTVLPGCKARRLFSDHGDSCMMNSSGEFLTPLLDIGRYDNTFRLHVELWQYAAYSAEMDIYAVNVEGVMTHLKTLGVNNTRSSLVFDSVFTLADSTVRLSFVADAMLKVDNIRLSNSMREQQEQGTVTTTADSCVFSSLTPNTVYHCFIQGQEDTLSFVTRDVIRVDSVCDVSPYGVSVHLTLNMRDCPHSYVLKRLSDQTTAYANDLFFSQFVTSDTYHRAIEIYNGTGEDVPLEDYRLAVDIYAGTGNYSSSSTLTFTDRDTIRHNECIVVMQTLNDMNQQSEGVYYINPDLNASRPIDGNDPFALIRGNDTVDIFGSFSAAVSNNYGWQDGDMRTTKVCIKRKSSVTKGVINSGSEGFPTLAMEWEQVGNVADTDAEVFADIGTHHMEDALSGECMDSVVVGFETTEDRIGIEGLEQYTTYELYALVQNGEETYRSNTVRFRTGKVTQRTEDGVWHDGNWSRGIPEEKDEVILYNPLTLRIEEGTVAKCYRLTVRDTISEARAQLINDGQLVCRQGVYVERALGLAEGQEGSSVLLGFPISVVDSSMEALAACVTQTEGNVLHADMQVQSPLQTQAYRLDYTLAQTLCFKGLLNNDDVYDMSDNAREQLGDMEVMYAFNPYPFTVQVNQLLRQGVSLPQRLDGRGECFVPLTREDSLRAFEGFVMECVDSQVHAVLYRQPLSPLPQQAGEEVRISLFEADMSDCVTIRFKRDVTADYDIDADHHKMVFSEEVPSVALRHDDKSYAWKQLPCFEDSVFLDLDVHLPHLAVYDLKVEGDSLDNCLAILLCDRQSGQVLFDFAGQGTYSFQSPAADKAWQLRMYRQVSSSADVAEVSSMRLVQQGNRVEIQGRADVRLVEVYDMQARRVACSTDGPRVTLPCRGVFLVRAEAEGESATWKVVSL